MTSPAAAQNEPAPSQPLDPPLQPLDPRVRTMWHLLSAAGAAPVLLLALNLGFSAGLPAALGAAVLAVITVVVAAVGPRLRYQRWRYGLGAEELQIHRGVAWTTVTVIPYARLQFVDTKQGPLDRLFGLASLVVHTASPGTSGTLPGLALETAGRLRDRLSDVSRDDDASV